MRKVFLTIILSLLLVLFFIPISVSAGGEGCPTEGLVPCGNVDTCPCELCDFFVMFDRIVNTMLFRIVPVLAALMIAIGGVMYITAFLSSEGAPAMLSRAKKLFGAIAIGLLIIYGAWVIVNTFLLIIGASTWVGFGEGWWIINCD